MMFLQTTFYCIKTPASVTVYCHNKKKYLPFLFTLSFLKNFLFTLTVYCHNNKKKYLPFLFTLSFFKKFLFTLRRCSKGWIAKLNQGRLKLLG